MNVIRVLYHRLNGRGGKLIDYYYQGALFERLQTAAGGYRWNHVRVFGGRHRSRKSAMQECIYLSKFYGAACITGSADLSGTPAPAPGYTGPLPYRCLE